MKRNQKMRLLFVALCMVGTTSFGAAMAGCKGKQVTESVEGQQNDTSSVTNDLGGLPPAKALEYMKKTPNLVIVDVAARRWYAQEHFDGAVNIPIEELSSEEEKELYLKLPGNRPVLLHCRRGMIVPGAYRTLKSLRPDLSEISYIDGVPPFKAYNEWAASQGK